jgi:hypothetical protein
MKKSVALFAAFAVLSSVTALAGPPKDKKADKKAAKVTDVWTCPMTKEAIKDHSSADKGEVVGTYRVHFCCAGCQPNFDKLSEKEKKEKIAAVTKKSSDKKSDKKDKKKS